jgi:hypothetical protein
MDHPERLSSFEVLGLKFSKLWQLLATATSQPTLGNDLTVFSLGDSPRMAG